MDVIKAKNIKKSFGSQLVLDDVSFDIKQGSFTALLGHNGSGKSTTLNVLMGQIKLDQGDCWLFGENIKHDPHHLKNKIGHVSENIRFDYPLDVLSFMHQYGKLFASFDMALFQTMAKEVKLDVTKHFNSYSRGQKMQIVLMAALSHAPEILLIDEITSVLDAFTRTYFINKLKGFTAQGGTVVITTNIVSEVQYYCTDVIFLSQNKIKFKTALLDIPSNFKKVRWTNKDQPPSEKYILSGTNSDGTLSFIVPNKFVPQAIQQGMVEDLRSVTLEDLYIYHSQDEAA